VVSLHDPTNVAALAHATTDNTATRSVGIHLVLGENIRKSKHTRKELHYWWCVKIDGDTQESEKMLRGNTAPLPGSQYGFSISQGTGSKKKGPNLARTKPCAIRKSKI
jgi:hypothetical protein